MRTGRAGPAAPGLPADRLCIPLARAAPGAASCSPCARRRRCGTARWISSGGSFGSLPPRDTPAGSSPRVAFVEARLDDEELVVRRARLDSAGLPTSRCRTRSSRTFGRERRPPAPAPGSRSAPRRNGSSPTPSCPSANRPPRRRSHERLVFLDVRLSPTGRLGVLIHLLDRRRGALDRRSRPGGSSAACRAACTE